MTNDSVVLVSVSIGIGGNTRISYRVHDGGLVELSVGDGELDLVTTEPGLRNLAVCTQEALRAIRSTTTSPDESR